MLDFVFITDLHIGVNNVRSGSVVEDILRKLDFVKDYTNKYGAQLLIGGDIFDKPTVPDVIKIPFIKKFLEFNKKPFVVYGNHDTLFASAKNNYKTTLQLFIEAGVFRILTSVDLQELFLTAELPLKNVGKPQLVMYHGFLNKEDGKNTVLLQDLQTTDNTLVLLGHDHVVYDEVQFGTVKVLRPGSFLRGIRNGDSKRIPQLVHIKCNGKEFKYRCVPIKTARDASEIFKTKKDEMTKAQRVESYQSVIEAIKLASSKDISFTEAINTVADEETAVYINQILNECKIKLKSK